MTSVSGEIGASNPHRVLQTPVPRRAGAVEVPATEENSGVVGGEIDPNNKKKAAAAAAEKDTKPEPAQEQSSVLGIGMGAIGVSPSPSSSSPNLAAADGKIPLDPWGEPYQYRYPGTRNKNDYDLFSKRLDRQPDTADDIGNW